MVILLKDVKIKILDNNLIFIIVLGDKCRLHGLKLISYLRAQEIPCDINLNYGVKSLKSSLRKANQLNAKTVIFVGENEMESKSVIMKDMASGKQQKLGYEF